MFAYCNNNPVMYYDVSGDRLVGIGVQGELSAGEASIGIEVIIYFDEKVCDGQGISVVYYMYSGEDVSAESLLALDNITDSLCTMVSMELDSINQDSLLIMGKALLEDIGFSGSFFYIDGNETFSSPDDYSGPFETITFSGYFGGRKAGMYYSYCDTCYAVGIKVGFSTPISHILPVDITYSRTEYSHPYEIARLTW